jgi:hypothetical protein
MNEEHLCMHEVHRQKFQYCCPFAHVINARDYTYAQELTVGPILQNGDAFLFLYLKMD